MIYVSLLCFSIICGRNKVNLEAIMSVILGLKEKVRIRDNLGELGIFMLERKGIIDLSNGSEFKKEVLDKLETEFKKHVRSKVISSYRDI